MIHIRQFVQSCPKDVIHIVKVLHKASRGDSQSCGKITISVCWRKAYVGWCIHCKRDYTRGKVQEEANSHLYGWLRDDLWHCHCQLGFSFFYDGQDGIFECLATRDKGCLESSSVSVLVNIHSGLVKVNPSPFSFSSGCWRDGGLIKGAVDNNYLPGVKLGSNELCICVQKFTDDTLISMEPSLQNVLSVKAIFRCYKATLGLRVNFHKSKLIGIATHSNVTRRFASLLNCLSASIPFPWVFHWVLIITRRKREGLSQTDWGGRWLLGKENSCL